MTSPSTPSEYHMMRTSPASAAGREPASASAAAQCRSSFHRHPPLASARSSGPVVSARRRALAACASPSTVQSAGSSTRPSASTLPSARKLDHTVVGIVNDDARRRGSPRAARPAKRAANAASRRARRSPRRSDPAARAPGEPQLAAGARAARRPARAAPSAQQHGQPVAGAGEAARRRRRALSSNAARGNQAWVKSGCGSTPSKTSTARPRYCCTRGIEAAAAPVGRAAVAGLDHLAGVVDPDLRLAARAPRRRCTSVSW